MEGINKIISLFLGLIVVIILFAIITGRFSPFKSKTSTSNTVKISATPTPTTGSKKFLGIFDLNKSTPTPKATPTPNKVVINNTTQTNSYQISPTQIRQVNGVSTIPSTGSPTELLPLFSSALLAGVYLRRKK